MAEELEPVDAEDLGGCVGLGAPALSRLLAVVEEALRRETRLAAVGSLRSARTPRRCDGSKLDLFQTSVLSSPA